MKIDSSNVSTLFWDIGCIAFTDFTRKSVSKRKCYNADSHLKYIGKYFRHKNMLNPKSRVYQIMVSFRDLAKRILFWIFYLFVF